MIAYVNVLPISSSDAVTAGEPEVPPIAIDPNSGILSMKSDTTFQSFGWIDQTVDNGVYVEVQLTDNTAQTSEKTKVYIKILGSSSVASITATISPSGVASLTENTTKGTILGSVSKVLDNIGNTVSPLTYKIVAVSPPYFPQTARETIYFFKTHFALTQPLVISF